VFASGENYKIAIRVPRPVAHSRAIHKIEKAARKWVRTELRAGT
jgi:hypothetical protein